MPAATKDMEYGACASAESLDGGKAFVRQISKENGPSVYKVHAALAAGYCLFAGGAIVGKFGVHGTSAIIFELFREFWSLVALSAGLFIFKVSPMPAREDVPTLLLGGTAFFFNQVFWFVALKIADPVTGSAWQTFLPILTALLSVILGQTTLEGLKALGILISSCGAIFMVVFDTRPTKAILPRTDVVSLLQQDDALGAELEAVVTDPAFLLRAVSHLIFFCNIAGTACYFIIMNRFGTKYSPLQTVTWAILVSIVLLSITAMVMFAWRPLHQVFCHSDDHSLMEKCMDQGFSLPTTVYFPLFYEVVVCTLMAWPMLNWANQHTDPAVVSVYMGLHPAAVTFICMSIVGVMGSAWAHQFQIGMPRLKDLGIVMIVLGLMVVFRYELQQHQKTALEVRSKRSMTA
jgi:drug/metabolite transporter (DMT)-like permease